MIANLLNPIGWILLIAGWLQRRRAQRVTDTLIPPHVRDLADGSVEPNLPGPREGAGSTPAED